MTQTLYSKTKRIKTQRYLWLHFRNDHLKPYTPKQKGLRPSANSGIDVKTCLKPYTPKQKGLRLSHGLHSWLVIKILKPYTPKQKGLRHYFCCCYCSHHFPQTLYSKTKRIKTINKLFITIKYICSNPILQNKKD